VAIEQLGVSPTTGQMAIRSPLSGLVLAREGVPGAVVQAGAPLVTVSDIGTLWLKIAAPDRAANALATGQTVRFTVAALPGETFQARVDSLGGGLDPQTRTIPVRATVANPGGRLRPHMFATVLLEVGDRANAVAIPGDAVVLLDERPAVFIAAPESGGGARLERRNVQVGGQSGERTLVIGGLRPDDNVVVRGAFAVKSLFERAKMPS
jgi:RND family efflux transporter MFP subunit